jgi:hypothetical protein
MRLLTKSELQTLSALSDNSIEFGLLELTATGLSKSILDATQDFRSFLERSAVHDYAMQKQGQDAKKKVPARIWKSSSNPVHSTASLYRPETKKGDPRVWFSELGKVAKPGDIVAIFWDGQSLNVLALDISVARASQLDTLVQKLGTSANSAREQLRHLLEEIGSRGWIMSRKPGSTAVGHLLETELGIEQNSSKNPDFQGIEIKSSSKSRTSANRYTLFAKVPTWPLSPLKSSAEILDRYGYMRDGSHRLYCTVDAVKPNSQGLQFKFDEVEKNLIEFAGPDDVAVWEEAALIHSLEQKHRETFWVKAEKKMIDGHIAFRYRSVINTKNPISSQFIPLMRDGYITMDHLIKRTGTAVSEKGPLFKIRSDSLDLLFPEPATFDLGE